MHVPMASTRAVFLTPWDETTEAFGAANIFCFSMDTPELNRTRPSSSLPLSILQLLMTYTTAPETC